MTLGRRTRWAIAAAVVLVAAGVALRLWVFDIIVLKRPTTDMWPTAGAGAVVVVNRRATPARGDLVILSRRTKDGGFILRRVVGLPGETVWFLDSRPYVDRAEVRWRPVGRTRQGDRWYGVFEESLGDARYPVLDDENRRMHAQFGRATGDGYYVLADNREHLTDGDSRSFGPVPPEEIRGVVSLLVDTGEVPTPHGGAAGTSAPDEAPAAATDEAAAPDLAEGDRD